MNLFTELTWDNLTYWAGAKTLAKGKAYQKEKRVKEIYFSPGRGIIGRVQGSMLYTTSLMISETKICSSCSCPVGGGCKHAVAVLLEYLDLVKNNRSVKEIRGDDQIWNEGSGRRSSPVRNSLQEVINSEDTDTRLRTYLKTFEKGELIDRILSIAAKNSDLFWELNQEERMTMNPLETTIRSLKRQIDQVTSEEYEYDDWSNENEAPDYSGIKKGFIHLLTKGEYDVILDLGKDLFEKGTAQAEMDDERGSIGSQIEECMDIVIKASIKSDKPRTERLLYAIDLCLIDEYRLINIEPVVSQTFSKEDWSKVADILMDRIGTFPDNSSPSAYNYERAKAAKWIDRALEKSSRGSERKKFAESEAEHNGRYLPYVNLLIDSGSEEEAIQWARKGINHLRLSQHGTTSELMEILCNLLVNRSDWLMVTSMRTEKFFASPTLIHYREIREAAKVAGVWGSVRPILIRFLTEGVHPDLNSGGETGIIPGVLPATGILPPNPFSSVKPPEKRLLIEIAIDDGDPDEVLRWYDSKAPELPHRYSRGSLDDSVATAIFNTYPMKAVEIWDRLVHIILEQGNVQEYTYAVRLIYKIGEAYKIAGDTNEYTSYLQRIRTEQKRKRRFIQELDNSGGKKVIESI